MNQFCSDVAGRLQAASATLPTEVFTVYVSEPEQDEFGEDTSKMSEAEAQEDFNGRRHWLVFETLGAATKWAKEQGKRVKCSIEKSSVDTIEWLDLLVLNDVFSPYLSVKLVKGKLVRTPRKWVK